MYTYMVFLDSFTCVWGPLASFVFVRSIYVIAQTHTLTRTRQAWGLGWMARSLSGHSFVFLFLLFKALRAVRRARCWDSDHFRILYHL